MTYSEHYNNIFDSNCWAFIATIAEDYPGCANILILTKAVTEFFQEIILRGFIFIENCKKLEERRIIPALNALAALLISPITGIMKTIETLLIMKKPYGGSIDRFSKLTIAIMSFESPSGDKPLSL